MVQEGRGDSRLLVYSHAQGGQSPLLGIPLAVAKPSRPPQNLRMEAADGVLGNHRASTITQKNGGATVSSAVVLETR